MKTKRIHRIASAAAGMLVMLLLAVPAPADVQIGARIQIHPRPADDLQISIWPDRGEGASYAIGDPIAMNVEANKDCFLILYNIDTRGNLRILFPYDPWDDNFVSAGDVIRFPRSQDGYDWTVDGPAGIEYVQAIATEFPIDPPDWPVYMRSVNHGGAIDHDPELRDFRAGNDRLDYIRMVNRKITGRYWDWCATDLATFHVYPRYYEKVNVDYDPWPDVFYGEVYINWPIGATIYVDGVYIGIAPLWLPRHYYGRHVITCYRGARLIRRHEFAFHPKADCRFRIEGHDYDDIRDRGYVKPGRRGGAAEFRDDIQRYKVKREEFGRGRARERVDVRSEQREPQFKERRRAEQIVEPKRRVDQSSEMRRTSPEIRENRTERPRRQKEAGQSWLKAASGAPAGTIGEGKSNVRHESNDRVGSKKVMSGKQVSVGSKSESAKVRVEKSKQVRSDENDHAKHGKKR